MVIAQMYAISVKFNPFQITHLLNAKYGKAGPEHRKFSQPPRSSHFTKETLTCAHQLLLHLNAVTMCNGAVASILTSAQIFHASLAFFTVSS